MKFDEIIDAFWRYPIGDQHVALTDEAVRAAEEQLGVVLPASLLRLLKARNGGFVSERWDAFPVAGSSWSEHYACFDYLAGIRDADHHSSILETPYMVREWELPSPVVLLHGDGHWWVALDYRGCGRTGEPSVVWIDDEADALFLASDFGSFIVGLIVGLTSSDQFATDDD